MNYKIIKLKQVKLQLSSKNVVYHHLNEPRGFAQFKRQTCLNTCKIMVREKSHLDFGLFTGFVCPAAMDSSQLKML